MKQVGCKEEDLLFSGSIRPMVAFIRIMDISGDEGKTLMVALGKNQSIEFSPNPDFISYMSRALGAK